MDERAAGAHIYLTGDLDRYTLERALRAGTLQRIRRGAYAPVVEHEDRYVRERVRARQRMHAIARQLQAPFWFSHASAALLHGLPLNRTPERTHLMRAGHPSSRSDPSLVRHRVVPEDSDRTVIDALPATSLLRTAVDCAMTMPDLGALMILDRVLAQPEMDTALAARLDRVRGARGSARARWRLDRADGRAESAGETAARFTLMRHGLRVPDLQIEVPTDSGRYRIDMGWRDLKIGLEFDGKVKYTRMAEGDPAEVVFREKRRQDALEREGWILIRVVWADLARPGRLLAEVHRRIAERTAGAARIC